MASFLHMGTIAAAAKAHSILAVGVKLTRLENLATATAVAILVTATGMVKEMFAADPFPSPNLFQLNRVR